MKFLERLKFSLLPGFEIDSIKFKYIPISNTIWGNGKLLKIAENSKKRLNKKNTQSEYAYPISINNKIHDRILDNLEKVDVAVVVYVYKDNKWLFLSNINDRYTKCNAKYFKYPIIYNSINLGIDNFNLLNACNFTIVSDRFYYYNSLGFIEVSVEILSYPLYKHKGGIVY